MSQKIGVRDAALQVILLTEKGMHIQQALTIILAGAGLEGRDISLCNDLAYGYFRTLIRLQYILNATLPNAGNLPPVMRIYLGLAVYSMLFQDSIPYYAILDQTAKLVAKKYGRNLARVANGCLRSVQRLGNAPNDPEWYINGKKDAFDGLAIFYAMPNAVANLWRKAYGEDVAIQLLRRSFIRPHTGLRLNATHPEFSALYKYFSDLAVPLPKIGKTGFALPPGYISEHLDRQKLRSLQHEGAISWQAAGSMQIMEELHLHKWTDPVWDACAGFGGKSLALLENGVNVLLASDISAPRLAGIEKQCIRLKLKKPATVLADACQPPLGSWPGNILVDAPCSGLGVLGRRPDIRLSVSKKDWSVKTYAALQQKILSQCCALLAGGRELAYITCTLNPLENEQVIENILHERQDLELISQWQTAHEHPWLEGMYGAVLRKIQ